LSWRLSWFRARVLVVVLLVVLLLLVVLVVLMGSTSVGLGYAHLPCTLSNCTL